MLWHLIACRCSGRLQRAFPSGKGIDLSVAYALWGGFGIAATLAAGWVLFGQRLNPKGWVGVILLLAGMVMIKFA